MECPNCRAAAPDGAADCPACGLIFAKWAERSARERAERLAAAAALLNSPAPEAPARSPGAPDGAALTPRETVFLPAAIFLAAELLVHTGLGRFLIQAGLSM